MSNQAMGGSKSRKAHELVIENHDDNNRNARNTDITSSAQPYIYLRIVWCG